MKTTRLFQGLCLVVVVAGTVVLWRQILDRGKHPDSGETNTVSRIAGAPGETILPPARHPSQSPEEKTARTDASQATAESNRRLADMGITPDLSKEQMHQKALEWYRTQAAKLAPEQKPIEFYGRVVDQSTQSIAGASVHFIWSDAFSQLGTATADTVSTADGAFSLTGVAGSAVSVYVTKEGYYAVRSLNRIDFDPTGNGSSKENPALFHFRKKGPGTDLITSKYGVNDYLGVSAPRDGTPVVVDFFNRKTGGEGQLILSNVKPAYENWKQATEWSYRLAIPVGGFLETREEFPYEAPESGYQEVIEFNFQKGTTNWLERFDKTYYIAFGNPCRYGRIRVKTTIMTGTILEYAINPDGSRCLEPK